MIYELNFIINVVVESFFKNKKLYFDTRHRHLYQYDFIIILMFRVKAYYILENNRNLKN